MKLFRVAALASPVRNLVKTLSWMLLVWFLALVALPTIFVLVQDQMGIPGFDFPGRLWVGLLVFVLGSTGGIWCAFTMALAGAGTPVPFDAARQLVVSGPYRYVRNPMALTAIIQTIGVFVMTGSWLCGLIPIFGALLWQWFIRPPEERFLTEIFGADYLAYQRAVRCWVPGRPYRKES